MMTSSPSVLLAWLICAILFLFLLCVLLFSLLCFIGYLYDIVLARPFLRLGHFIGKTLPRIKQVPVAVRIWNKVQPKSVYLRYEVPLFALGFSFLAVLLIAEFLYMDYGINILVASLIYASLFFLGMGVRFHGDEQRYNNALTNCSDFLKLSFLPLSFSIAVIGFICSVFGQEALPFSDFATLDSFVHAVIDACYSINDNPFNTLEQIGLLALFLYIFSLPIQVMSYYIIEVIKYFGKYKTAYLKFIKNFFRFIHF